MFNRLKLFNHVVKNFTKKTQTSSRKLYTDHIYPYPFNYFNNKIYPSQVLYRESWPWPFWQKSYDRIAQNIMRIFWTWWWYQLFWNPGVILGHHTFPEPSEWTDEQLGIPPDSYGSYAEWMELRDQKSQQKQQQLEEGK